MTLSTESKETKDAPNEKETKKEEPGFFSFENLKSLAILVVIVMAVRWSIASPYYVPTASMEPTIKVGDRLLAFKLAYDLKIPFTDISIASWSKVKRGDIIVFRYPKDPDLDYVKRVVGVAGDKIRLIDDVLYVNDQPQTRVNYNHKREILRDIEDHRERKILFKETLGDKVHWTMNQKPEARHFSQSSWPENGSYMIVPEGSVFVFGDNRDNSADSRVWGKVPLEYIHGKATFVLWSLWHPDDGSWFSLRFDRFGHILDGDLPDPT